MFLFNWASYFIEYFKSVLFTKSGTIVFIGLDNAGKTSLLHRLLTDKLGYYVPTHYPTCEEVIVNRLKLRVHDLGGHEQVRKVWKDYYTLVDAVVFIIDSSDRERILEAKDELKSMLNDELVETCPVLILGNKIDKETSIGEYELRDILELHGITTGEKKSNEHLGRPVELFMCSILKREGYGDAFRWLLQYL